MAPLRMKGRTQIAVLTEHGGGKKTERDRDKRKTERVQKEQETGRLQHRPAGEQRDWQDVKEKCGKTDEQHAEQEAPVYGDGRRG